MHKHAYIEVKHSSSEVILGYMVCVCVYGLEASDVEL